MAVLRGHKDEVKALAFSPDGRSLASAGRDLAVYLWHVPTWRDLGVLERGSYYTWLRFKAHGHGLLGGDHQQRVRWLALDDDQKGD